MKNTSVNNAVVRERRARGGFKDPTEPDGDDGVSGKGYDPPEPDADDKVNNGSAADRARGNRAKLARGTVKASSGGTKKNGNGGEAIPNGAKGGTAARDLQKPVGTGGGKLTIPVGKKTLT